MKLKHINYIIICNWSIRYLYLYTEWWRPSWNWFIPRLLRHRLRLKYPILHYPCSYTQKDMIKNAV